LVPLFVIRLKNSPNNGGFPFYSLNFLCFNALNVFGVNIQETYFVQTTNLVKPGLLWGKIYLPLCLKPSVVGVYELRK